MPSDAVLRRKAQKKKKRRGYSRCSYCGGPADIASEFFGIGKRPIISSPGDMLKLCRKCNLIDVLHWTGVPG